jgi:hypothetical protein
LAFFKLRRSRLALRPRAVKFSGTREEDIPGRCARAVGEQDGEVSGPLFRLLASCENPGITSPASCGIGTGSLSMVSTNRGSVLSNLSTTVTEAALEHAVAELLELRGR